MDVVLDFGNGFVFGINGVDSDGVEDNAELFVDGIGDTARNLVKFGDGKSIF